MTRAKLWRDIPRALRCFGLGFALAFGLSSVGAAEELTVGGTGSGLGPMRLLALTFTAANPDVVVTIVPNLGSAGGVKAVVEGAIGLAVTSRPRHESERKRGAVAIEYARTPFVFAISDKSKLAAITSAELADIYAGTTRFWADGSPVRIVLRPVSDIDSDIIKSISPALKAGLAAAEARPGVRFSVTDQDAADDLEKVEGTIGPSTLALIQSEKRALRPLRLDGKEPTIKNAASGAYPYNKHLYLVTGSSPSKAARRFIAFVRSPAGRRILAGSGHWIP